MDDWLIKLPNTINSPSTSTNDMSTQSTSTTSSNSSNPPPKRKRFEETADTGDSADEIEEHERRHEIKKNKKATSSKRNFKFRLEWLQEDIFKDWLRKEVKTVSSRSNSNVQEYAHCKICKMSIFPHRNDLFRHLKTEKHSFKARQIGDVQNIEHLLTSPHENKIRYAEIKLAALLAAKNLPFSLMDDLVEVCGEIYSDPIVAQKLKLKRTKATAVLKNVVAPNIQKDLINAVSSPGNFFSMVLDETTDTSTIKQCAFVIIYCDMNNKVQTRFFDMIEQNRGDAQSLYLSLKKCLEEKKVPFENMIGLSTDTTNVMVGSNHSLFTLVKKDLPHVALIKCSCHMIHLATSKACLELPRSVEDVVRNIGAHFSRSALRQENFREFQEFFKTDIHKMLLPSNTRSLSLEQCSRRVLEQYEPLKAYFRLICTEDPSKTTEDISRSLNNSFTKIYLEFLVYVLSLVNSFNTLFQSETPLLHKLKPETEKLLRTLCSNFMVTSLVKKTNIFRVNVLDPHNCLPLDKLYLGVTAQNSLQELKNDESCTVSEIERFQISCLKFYKVLIQEIRNRFKFDDSLYDIISVVEPTTAQHFEIKSLAHVLTRFPNLKEFVNEQMLDNEWREHALLNHESYGLRSDLNAEEYWATLFKLKNAAGNQLFSNLKILINFLLTSPFSNACVERVFSVLNNIKTDNRNRLKTDTLKAIIYTQEAVKKEGGCAKFKPSDKMINMSIWKNKN